jgi:hypothetical protein
MRSRCAFGRGEIGDLESTVSLALANPRLFYNAPFPSLEFLEKLTTASAESMCLVVALAEGGRSLRWGKS